MKTVHKYLLNDVGEDTSLKLKQGFKILHCQYVLIDKAIYLWVEEPLPAETPYVEETFRIVKSGEPLPALSQHIATTVDVYSPEAYHVFNVSRQLVAAVPAPLSEVKNASSETLQLTA